MAACIQIPWRGPKAPSASGLTFNRADLPAQPRYAVTSGHPTPDGSSASASPLAVKHVHTGTGILTRFPSPTPLGLGLGAGLPGADDPGSGTLRLSVWGILPPIIAYSFRHTHFPALHRCSSEPASSPRERSPTMIPLRKVVTSVASAVCLSPDHYRRRST